MNSFQKSAGWSLLVSSILMVLTMALHPAGGSIEHLMKISTVIIVTHSMAITTVPISLFGFWGLTNRLQQSYSLAFGAFFVISSGLFAVMVAAALNGLALPFFLAAVEPDEVNLSMAKQILHYNMALNHAFDYIYIGASCVGVVLYSIAILRSKQMPAWIAYAGIALSVVAIALLAAGFVFVDLHGFSFFIFGFVLWVTCVGIALIRSNANQLGTSS